MSDKSQIQWTDATWNPTTGCTKISPGCANCYIVRTPAFRIHGRRFVKGATDLRLHEDRLDQPLRWSRPRRIFVNSLSDLFHEAIPDAFIDRVFAVMAAAHWHQFQVLTKRPQRMRAYLSQTRGPENVLVRVLRAAREMAKPKSYVAAESFGWPYRNVWLGVSVENQRFADERIPLLLDTPAAVRFISAEPLLGPVDLYSFLHVETSGSSSDWRDTRLGWVIVGGESGPNARTFDAGWARAILLQCQVAGVPCFVKQLGSRMGLKDVKGGDPAEWAEDLRVREYPEP